MDRYISTVSVSSIHPVSLENRLRIRPAGVVSKRLTGALRTDFNILLWSLSEDLNTKRLNSRVRVKANSKAAAMILPYIAKVVGFL